GRRAVRPRLRREGPGRPLPARPGGGEPVPARGGRRAGRRRSPLRRLHQGEPRAALAPAAAGRGPLRMPGGDQVAAALAAVRARIDRAGGDLDAITIVAVTKGQPVEACRAAVALGLDVLGENRVQEALAKMDEVPGATWHLIG